MIDFSSFLEQGNNFIKDNFDLKDPQPEIILSNSHKSFYSPKENKVFLSKEYSLADFAHEYFGHALYTQNSSLGRVLLSYLSNSKCPKRKTEDLFQKILPIQEGFSFWMEEKLLKNLGYKELWNHRQEIIFKSPYYSAYRSFLNEEKETGPLTLMYKLGFPKSKRKDIIAKVAKENLKHFSKLKYLFQYGSLERDIDLLAVYPDETVEKDGLIYDGNIDIHVLKESSFSKKVNLWDIEIMDPILSGELLVGDDFISKIERITSLGPSKEIIFYSYRRSLETFNSALFFYNQNRYKCINHLIKSNRDVSSFLFKNHPLDICSSDLMYVLNNLCFSLSYKFCGDYYLKYKKPITFQGILEQSQILKNLRNYLKDIEWGKKVPEELKVKALIKETKNYISEIPN